MAHSRTPPTHFSCSVCHQTFGRQEHLTRHFRSHTHEKPYRCSQCGKRFSRLDVLTRHKASHEQQHEVASTPVSSRACKQCAADRVRCSRSLPCKRCSERGLSCCYPAGGKAPISTNSGEQGGTQLPTFQDPSLALEEARVASHGHGLENQPSPPTVNNDAAGAASSITSRNPTGNSIVWPDPYDGFANLCDIDLPSLGPLGINWISPGYQYDVDWDMLPNDYAIPRLAHDFGVQAAQASIANGQLDAEPQLQQPRNATPLSDSLQTCNSTKSPINPGSAGKEYYVDGDGSRAPFRGRFHDRGSVTKSQVLHAPIGNSTAAPDSAHSPAPTDSLPLEAYENLVQAVMQQDQSEEFLFDIAHFPSYTQIHLYVQQYFECFHPIFPFLRKASFADVDSAEWLLLLAVAAVGSRYMQHSHGRTPRKVLSRMLTAALRRYRNNYKPQRDDEQNDSQYIPGQHAQSETCPNIRILQASILSFICLLHSGKKALVGHALRERHYLVEACNALSLVTRPSDSEAIFMHGSGDDLTLRWLTRESEIRTGMMIWFLDSKMLYEFNLKPLMDLDDIKAVLPSCEDVWENPLLVLQGEKVFPTMTFMGAMEALYIEKRLPQDLSEFSIGLLVQAIFRNTKKQLLKEQTRLNSWMPSATAERHHNNQHTPNHQLVWLPSTSTASKWRNSACDSLDILHWHSNSKVAKSSGSEHHTILHLHLARIIMLTPTQCVQTLAANLVSTSLDTRASLDWASLAPARHEILQWVVRDRYKARLAIIHCAALYWHVRRYSCDSFLEPYAIFIATLVLWAFCIGMQLPEVVEATAQDSEGSPEPSFCHLDRPLDDELVQLFVRAGHKMCPNISKVGNILKPQAAPKVLQEGHYLLTVGSRAPVSSEHDSIVDTPCFTWGIEESYAKVLGDLVVAATQFEDNDSDQVVFPWNLNPQ